MIFEITNISDPGVLAKERVIMKAIRNCDLGKFAIFMATADADGLPMSGNVAKSYWFANKEIKAGDLVVLYTKTGPDSEKQNASGSTSHFYYWDLDEPLWNTTEYAAVLVNTDDWMVFRKAAKKTGS